MGDKIEVMKWTPRQAGTLEGFVDVLVKKWNLIIYGVAIFNKEGNRWCTLPNREVKDPTTGEVKRFSHIRFTEKSYMDAFGKEILMEVDAHKARIAAQPETFTAAEDPLGDCPF